MLLLPILPNLDLPARRQLPLVAVKIQRRKYASQALDETAIHGSIDRSQPGSRYIIRMLETCVHDGHICQVFEKSGRALSDHVESRSLLPQNAQLIAKQVLQALSVLHSQGLVHTDIKPENLLWNKRTRQTRLIDLGNAERRIETGDAIATREYSPPEMLVGLPMGAPVDLWSLGCTVYELLTGKVLFHPRSVCESKYEEFGAGEEESMAEDDEKPSLDDLDEEAEQLVSGTVIQEKYQLLRPLGRGKFGTVWEARPLHNRPLTAALPGKAEAREIAARVRRPQATVPVGRYCVYEVALNYEHFVLMQRRCGRFPDALARGGQYAHILYDEQGKLRFDPDLKPLPIARDLIRIKGLSEDEAGAAADFIETLLRLDPAQRPTAADALKHPWLAGMSS